MAKRKRSAALFEVFNDKRSALAGGGSASRPLHGWFSPRAESNAGNVATAPDPNDPTTGSIRSALIAPRIAAVEAMDGPATAAPAESQTHERIEPLRSRLAARAAAQQQRRFQIDPDTREITLIVPFTTAIIAVFAMVVLIGLSYVIGHRLGVPVPVAKTDQVTDDEANHGIQPGALEVPRRAIAGQGQVAGKPASPKNSDDTRHGDRDLAPRANDVSQLHDGDSGDGPRVIGLNYLLVQVYPNLAAAAEARDYLLKNGIGCTIEKVPDGFYCPDKSWLAVITTRGFDRDQLHSGDYEKFKHQIEDLSDSFATTTKNKNKRFSLQTYKLLK